MKILTFILVVFSSFSINPTSTVTNIEWYGQVLDEYVYLYRTPIDIINDNVYFIVEPTYFVKLLANENSLFYKAQYMDISCYIKKSQVQVIKNAPNIAFLKNINFRVFSSSSQQMRTVPSSSGGNATQICYIPLFSKDAVYYGKVYGESAIEDRTNIWYYCKYSLDQDYYGYVYSDGCDQLTPIPKLTGTYEYVDFPNFNLKVDVQDSAIIKTSSPRFKYVIILICIPVAVILIMILKSNIILRLEGKEKAKEVKTFFDSPPTN